MTSKPVAQDLVRDLIKAIGLDVKGEHFLDTPRRFVAYLQEFNQGEKPLEKILETCFSAVKPGEHTFHGMLTQGNIPFRGCCPHHLLPYLGGAFIGYLPRRRLIGLSKLPRLVDAAGTIRPELQEHTTELIADKLQERLECNGVIVVVKAFHSCMGCRGANVPSVETTTSAIRGAFVHVPAARDEFFKLVGLH